MSATRSEYVPTAWPEPRRQPHGATAPTCFEVRCISDLGEKRCPADCPLLAEPARPGVVCQHPEAVDPQAHPLKDAMRSRGFGASPRVPADLDMIERRPDLGSSRVPWRGWRR